MRATIDKDNDGSCRELAVIPVTQMGLWARHKIRQRAVAEVGNGDAALFAVVLVSFTRDPIVYIKHNAISIFLSLRLLDKSKKN